MCSGGACNEEADVGVDGQIGRKMCFKYREDEPKHGKTDQFYSGWICNSESNDVPTSSTDA